MAKTLRCLNPPTVMILAAGLFFCSMFCFAADDASTGSPAADSGLYIKVQLANPVKMSKVKPGDVLEGSLRRDVYSSDRKLFSAGSQVRLTVDHLEKRRRERNDHWPWVINVFTPRHESYPTFKTATVAGTGGDSSLQVSLISASHMRDIHAKAKKGTPKAQSVDEQGAVEVSKSNQKKLATPTMVLEASSVDGAPATEIKPGSDEPTLPTPQTLPAGTQCKILLLGSVSASKSKPGDVVRARLLEPVTMNSKLIVPAGSLFEGKVLKKTPPRWLSRSGSLYLTFTDLILPGGNRFPVTASLAGAELDERSHTRMDSEGRLHGEHPGKAWMAINLGVTAGIAKEVDDGLQLVIEAIVSTATDASTAGTGRIVASCASAIYMATRHGRDVILPRFTEMSISLDRPVSLNPAAQIEGSGAVAGGK